MKQPVTDGELTYGVSPPAWGAWIETVDSEPSFLKSVVAPRVGGVD